MPDIYEYLDYRSFLKDAFKEIKLKKRFFTHRYVARQVGMKSTGHISWILSGKRNLSKKMTGPFASVFGLGPKESEFFEALVHFNQAKTHIDKKYYLDKLVTFHKRENKLVSSFQYELFDKWYYPVIRELVAIHKIKDDYKSLAKYVVPAISPTRAEQAVKLLERLKFIRRNYKGYLEQSNQAITASDAVKSVAIRQFQMDTFELGKQALDSIPKEERDISTSTMSISRERFEFIRERIKAFREEIMAAVKSDDDQEQVFQFNLALFPLSKAKAKRGNDA